MNQIISIKPEYLWRFYLNKEELWEWCLLEHTGYVLLNSASSFLCRKTCVNDAKHYGYPDVNMKLIDFVRSVSQK